MHLWAMLAIIAKCQLRDHATARKPRIKYLRSHAFPCFTGLATRASDWLLHDLDRPRPKQSTTTLVDRTCRASEAFRSIRRSLTTGTDFLALLCPSFSRTTFELCH
ncbi:unnamed protein product [Ixodes persulcatus]